MSEELAWAAGLFEGEGCITDVRKARRLALQLGMTDRDVVERFRDTVGVGTVREKTPDRRSRKQAFIWMVGGLDALSVIIRLRPYLGARRAEAADRFLDLAREFYSERECRICSRSFTPRRPDAECCSQSCKRKLRNGSIRRWDREHLARRHVIERAYRERRKLRA